jgi:tetratricopeptide (TPR) repeat protein
MPPGPPASFETLTAQATEQIRARQFREAAATFRRMGKLAPNAPQPLYNTALALWALGDLDEAVDLLRRVVTTELRLKALVRLANIRPSELTAAEKADIARGAREDADQSVRADLYFVLGGLLERDGDYDAAFAAFDEGNRLKRALLGESIGQSIGRRISIVAQAKAIFTPAFLAHHQGGGHPTAAPIFVVGMPRSGSTLVEQILASHPKVQGLGECSALSEVTRGQFPYPVTAPSSPDHFMQLARQYLNAMRALGLKNTPRFVDKTLSNDAGVGLLALMFPRATILEVVRDPVETGFANYRANFAAGMEESYDLREIGRAWRLHQSLMEHWRSVLPGRVVQVRYEALVADPTAQIRWLVAEVCGLDWDPACLMFHKTRRQVLTSSAVQVRQPIFTTAVDRWRRYQRHLGPLLEELGVAG